MNDTTTTGTWRDERLDPGARADLLLKEMTTAEKCHQLTARMSWYLVRPDGTDADGTADVLRNPPGHVAQLILDDPAKLADMVGTIQHKVISSSRLGIPALCIAFRTVLPNPAELPLGRPRCTPTP